MQQKVQTSLDFYACIDEFCMMASGFVGLHYEIRLSSMPDESTNLQDFRLFCPQVFLGAKDSEIKYRSGVNRYMSAQC